MNKTRLNRSIDSQKMYLAEIKISDDKKIVLDSSINIIIGDNGAGKSYILESIFKKKNNNYKNSEIYKNEILADLKGFEYFYMWQNQIEALRREDKLRNLPNVLIKTDNFKEKMSNFAQSLYRKIKTNIDMLKKYKNIKNSNFIINSEEEIFNLQIMRTFKEEKNTNNLDNLITSFRLTNSKDYIRVLKDLKMKSIIENYIYSSIVGYPFFSLYSIFYESNRKNPANYWASEEVCTTKW